MLPVTLGYPKELLAIINKPAIHLIIEEFIESGLKRIIIITGENPDPIRRTYDHSVAPSRGKHKMLDEFVDKLTGAEIIMEPQTGPYGNGTPLVVARTHIPKDQGFVYAYGDDLIKSKTPFTQKLIERHNSTGMLVVGTQRVGWEEVVRYGIAQIKEGSVERELEDVVEKPSRQEARSNLAMFGRFLLSDDIIQILTETP